MKKQPKTRQDFIVMELVTETQAAEGELNEGQLKPLKDRTIQIDNLPSKITFSI